MLDNHADLDSLNFLLDIFKIEKKRVLERYCNTITIGAIALTELFVAGRTGRLDPLVYACYFGEHVPGDVLLSDTDHRAIGSSSVGPLEGQTRKAFNKIQQTFEVRRLFAAYLFYTRDYKY